MMNETPHIGPDELVFYNSPEEGIHSGGFSVNSILMKAGMSPISTLNHSGGGGETEQVSDLFRNLVVPNWALSYTFQSRQGGRHKPHDDDSSSDEEDIEEELHEKLLELVKERKSSGKKNADTASGKNAEADTASGKNKPSNVPSGKFKKTRRPKSVTSKLTRKRKA